jgi:hypothetical protein
MKQAMVMGIIRAVLAGFGGTLTGAGYANESDWAQVVGAIMILIAAIWSVIEKKKIVLPSAAGMFLACVLGCGMVLTSGCATTANDVAMARIASDTAQNYYQQPNKADYMVMEGTNLEWTIKGATRLVFSGPIPAKSIYPREEGSLKQIMDGAGEIAKTAALGIVGYQGVKALKAQAPTVVTTEKLVPVAGAVVQ